MRLVKITVDFVIDADSVVAIREVEGGCQIYVDAPANWFRIEMTVDEVFRRLTPYKPGPLGGK